MSKTSHGEPGLDGQLSGVLVDAEDFDEREGDAETNRVRVAFDRSNVRIVAAQQLLVQLLLVLQRFCAVVATLHHTQPTKYIRTYISK